jgi:hypothetical protein
MSDDLNVQPDPTEPVEQPVSTVAPTESVLRTAAKKYGYSDEDLARFESDEQLADTLYGLADQYAQYRQQAEPLVQVGRQFAEHVDKLPKFQEWLSTQEKPAEPKEPEPPKFDWQVPEYDPAWESVTVEQDPVGYAAAQQKLNARKRWERETQRKLLNEYPQLTQQAVEPMLSAREKQICEYVDQKIVEARQTWDQERQKETVAQREQAWLQENAAAFYQHDENGQPVLRNGQMVPTDYGQGAWAAYQEAQQMTRDGKPLPFEQATRVAMALAGGNGKPAAPAPKPQSPSPPRFMETVSEAEMRPVERRPGGNEAPPSMYQNPDAAVEAAFREAAAETGVNLKE